MKRFLTVWVLMLSLSFSGFAQEPEFEPLHDTKIVRKVVNMNIEGENFQNVVVTMKSISPNFFSNKPRVRITIVDADGKKVWKKTMKDVYLYVFSNEQVQIGNYNFYRLLIQKSTYYEGFWGLIREQDGVY